GDRPPRLGRRPARDWASGLKTRLRGAASREQPGTVNRMNAINVIDAIKATVGVADTCRDAGPEARAPEARTERSPWACKSRPSAPCAASPPS
ncbi:hypothetical protein, partial [Streptomyces decoyicus]